MLNRLFRRPPPAEGTSARQRLPLLSLVVTIAVAIVVLMDVLLDVPSVNALGGVFVMYAVIVASFALILGVLHLLRVHTRRVQQRANGWLYSALLLITVVFFTVVGLIEGPTQGVTQWSVTYILLPLQSAFFSLLAFFLISVLYRSARIRSWESLLLVVTAVLVVIGGTPLGATLSPAIEAAKEWVVQGIATAGARGIVLGVAVGTVITAFRFIADGRRIFK